MAVCVYDNPISMARECWQDKKLLSMYPFSTLLPFAVVPIPPVYFLFGANIGPWNPGQIIGDPEAIQNSNSKLL